MAFEFTDSNFQETVLDKEGVAVVDFWAEWCGPCRMVGPVIEDLSRKGKRRSQPASIYEIWSEKYSYNPIHQEW